MLIMTICISLSIVFNVIVVVNYNFVHCFEVAADLLGLRLFGFIYHYLSSLNGFFVTFIHLKCLSCQCSFEILLHFQCGISF